MPDPRTLGGSRNDNVSSEFPSNTSPLQPQRNEKKTPVGRNITPKTKKENHKNKHRYKLQTNPNYQAPNKTRLYRSHLGLLHELHILQLPLPRGNVVFFLIRRHRVDAFGFPSGHSLLGRGDLAPDDLVLLAHLTFAGNAGCFVYQLHAACFARSVLLVAVCSESSPLVVTANEDLLVVETHVCLGVSETAVDI